MLHILQVEKYQNNYWNNVTSFYKSLLVCITLKTVKLKGGLLIAKYLGSLTSFSHKMMCLPIDYSDHPSLLQDTAGFKR